MAFRGDVVVRQVTGSTFELVEPVGYDGSRDSWTVPAGFVTDFASVPRVLIWLIPRYGDYTQAAVLHDWLVRERVVSRSDADGLFRRAMRELGVSRLRRWLMWAAVRLASGVSGGSWRERLWVALLTPPAVLLLAVPVLVVQVALLCFWAVEVVVWAWDRVLGRHDQPMPRMDPRT